MRHPKPLVPPGICYGRTDLPLPAAATIEIEHALERTGRTLVVLSSPAIRCRTLAEAIAERDGVKIIFDDRLRELDFGLWEGRPWSDIDRRESDPWADDPWHLAPPQGETFAALYGRMAEAVSQVRETKTLIVTHAGPIRAARMILEGASFEHVFADSVPYAQPLVMAPNHQESAANGRN